MDSHVTSTNWRRRILRGRAFGAEGTEALSPTAVNWVSVLGFRVQCRCYNKGNSTAAPLQSRACTHLELKGMTAGFGWLLPSVSSKEAHDKPIFKLHKFHECNMPTSTRAIPTQRRSAWQLTPTNFFMLPAKKHAT